MTWATGDQVKCIKQDAWVHENGSPFDAPAPAYGEVCTVRGTLDCNLGQALLLESYAGDGAASSFYGFRFERVS